VPIHGSRDPNQMLKPLVSQGVERFVKYRRIRPLITDNPIWFFPDGLVS